MDRGQWLLEEWIQMQVQKQVQKQVNDVLDKIRAEIEALPNTNPSYIHTCDVVDRVDVLDIIDNYKAGREVNADEDSN